MPWTSLCELDELREGRGRYVEIDGFRLAVFLNRGVAYTLDNTCPHAGASIASGSVDAQGCAVCPWHAWAFHLETGQLRGAPGVVLTTYATRVYERAGKPPLVQADLPGF